MSSENELKISSDQGTASFLATQFHESWFLNFSNNSKFHAIFSFCEIRFHGYFGIKQKNVFFSHPIETKTEVSIEPEIKYAATKMEGTELQQ